MPSSDQVALVVTPLDKAESDEMRQILREWTGVLVLVCH